MSQPCRSGDRRRAFRLRPSSLALVNDFERIAVRAVVAEVRRVIAEHADRPFVLGYRVSPEEAGEGGLRMADAYALIDGITAAGVDYIHASLSSVLDARPIGATDGETIAELIVAHVAGRVPVIAAGQMRTPDQAEAALARGLSLVAVGQGLVINPDWVELAQTGQTHQIATTLDVRTLTDIALPPLLWTAIDATKGWFAVSGSSLGRRGRRTRVLHHGPSRS